MAPLGVTPFLIRAMGHRNFRRYGFSGERIAAAEALRIGLVHQVCDAATVDDTLARIADALLHGAPGALAELKSAAAQFASPTLATILAHQRAAQSKIAGGYRRRRELPREAQTELVSAMSMRPNMRGRCRGVSLALALAFAAPSNGRAAEPRSTRPPRRKAKWSGTRA